MIESVRLQNISKNFFSNIVLENVNISMFPGDVVGLIGSNGAGKTTIIKLLSGLVLPDFGQIFINGFNLNIKRTVCMGELGVFLDGSRSIYWQLTVWQNFKYFAGLKGLFGHECKLRCLELFDLLELSTIKLKKVESISYGMKQRLAIACSISHNPSVVLLDEPSTGLDQNSQMILQKLIKQQAKLCKTTVIASHDIHLLENTCNKIFIIKNGNISNVS